MYIFIQLQTIHGTIMTIRQRATQLETETTHTVQKYHTAECYNMRSGTLRPRLNIRKMCIRNLEGRGKNVIGRGKFRQLDARCHFLHSMANVHVLRRTKRHWTEKNSLSESRFKWTPQFRLGLCTRPRCGSWSPLPFVASRHDTSSTTCRDM